VAAPRLDKQAVAQLHAKFVRTLRKQRKGAAHSASTNMARNESAGTLVPMKQARQHLQHHMGLGER
jgi:hypothetical protein